jgi:energy-coupling factor transport system substrate-specific component
VADLFGMWRSTRMIVLTAISAALYAAILIPFKVVPIIPGVTEFRPASAVPVVCSFLFGPAGAWGSAFGNLIGDLFGGLGPGDLFGFVGNLAYGFVPYAVWDAVTAEPPTSRSPRAAVGLAIVIAVAGLLCATIVGWGLHWLGFHPFTLLGPIVFANNVLGGVVLAPLLLRVLHPRVAKARLLYRDILGPRRPTSRARRAVALALVVGGTIATFVAGQLIATGRWHPPWAVLQTASGSAEVGLGLLPLLVLVALGCALL